MASDGYLPVGLLKAFYWIDDGLQNYLKSLGWFTLTRTQSMIMMNVISGVDRPAEIARNLGISRQAVHLTLGQMADQRMLRLEAVEGDKRAKRVVLNADVEPMRRDARRAVDVMTAELERRFGKANIRTLIDVTHADWGPAPTFPNQAKKKAAAPRGAKSKSTKSKSG